MEPMDGILLVDKPAGWTSHDVVAKLRGVLGERRMGHSGTLDPMATGLLVLFVGRATKAVSFSEAQEKRYRARLRLGVVTDTQDTTGTVLQTCPRRAARAELEAVLPRFRGEIEQLPPMYSAIKVQGKKLYEIARRGGEVERQPRRITIHELTVAGEQDGEFLLDIRCSKGTYVRTLCHDIGAALGCGGAMSALRRTAVGAYRVEEAHALEELIALPREEARRLLLPLDSLFADCAALALNAKQERLCRSGGGFACAAPDGATAAFEAMHRAWRDGQYYRCCGVLYDCLARVCTARPDAGGAADGGAHALDPALDAIRARYRDPDLDIPALAAQCGLSAPHFRRLFRRAYLMTPVQYLTRFRVAQAKNALAAGCSVADAAGRCGFRDPKYFSTVFHRVTGTTPGAWQSDGTRG